MISPIGSYLTLADAAINQGMDRLLVSTTSAVAVPVTLAASLFYVVQGLKATNGDGAPIHGVMLQALRVALVIYLSSNLDGFNHWVRDFFYTGLPNALNATPVPISATGGEATAMAGALPTTAATFDLLWAQMWAVLGRAKEQAGFLDPLVLVVDLAGFIGSFCLFAMAAVYLIARVVLALVVIAMPVLIACAMFETTRPIFERAVGKVVALICLQFVGIITLQLVFSCNEFFLDQIIAVQRAYQDATAYNPANNLWLPGLEGQAVPPRAGGVSAGAAFATTMQNVIAMTAMMLVGVFALYALPAIAYSIGTGIAISTAPAMLAQAAAAKETVTLLRAMLGKLDGMQMPSMPGFSGGPNYALGMPPKGALAGPAASQLGGPNNLLAGPNNYLPPPPPPALAGP